MNEIKNKMQFYGSNNLDAYEIFKARKNYKNKAVDEFLSSRFIDIWYDKPLYGKVDRNGNAVYISESNLKQLKSESGETLLAADFVVKAFEDLRTYFKKATLQRKLRQDSPLSSIVAKRAWVSSSNNHHEFIKMIYDIFIIKYLRGTGKENQILTFDVFLSHFVDFLKETKGVLPFTKSGFIYSRYSSCMSSGLVIEIEKENHSEDINKKSKFLDDVNFEFYKKATRKYGFLIDKNAPWRLIANVSSERMQFYMKDFGIKPENGSASNLFEAYFYKAFERDVEIMKRYLVFMWNSYVNAYKYVKITQAGATGVCTKTNLIERKEITEEYINNINENYWVQYYFLVRSIESQKNLDTFDFDNKLKKALQIKNYIDESSCLRYINSWCK